MGVITKIDLLCNLIFAHDPVLLNSICCFPLLSLSFDSEVNKLLRVMSTQPRSIIKHLSPALFVMCAHTYIYILEYIQFAMLLFY